MTLAVVITRALAGLQAKEVRVEVHLANGLPSFTLVGLADPEVKESRERVRAALSESGFAFPHNRRITVNLAPADLPKESGRFDLPIAVGILAASGAIHPERLAHLEFAGELSLAGELRPIRGALAMALAIRQTALAGGPTRTLILPSACAQAAARVPDLDVRSATHLRQVIQALQPPASAGSPPLDLPRALPGARPGQRAAPAVDGAAQTDLRDVRGQSTAKRALEIAAAGGHSLLLVGPPGTGKSMLAQRLPRLLPPLTEEEALQSAAVLSLQRGMSGMTEAQLDHSFGQRSFRAPHHSASPTALVGGGSPPQPGEISLAHAGVLFLDELPEFPRKALEALREPLETGHITLSRAAHQAQYPARFQWVAAMNPCPCGWLGSFAATGKTCRCTPDLIARYQGRLSGPLLDRIDLKVEVSAVEPSALLAAPEGEASATVAARVAQARQRMHERQGVPNAWWPAEREGALHDLDSATRLLLERAARQLGWSGRTLHRVLKVAWTIADLAGETSPGPAHVAEALQLRRALAQEGN